MPSWLPQGPPWNSCAFFPLWIHPPSPPPSTSAPALCCGVVQCPLFFAAPSPVGAGGAASGVVGGPAGSVVSAPVVGPPGQHTMQGPGGRPRKQPGFCAKNCPCCPCCCTLSPRCYLVLRLFCFLALLLRLFFIGVAVVLVAFGILPSTDFMWLAGVQTEAQTSVRVVEKCTVRGFAGRRMLKPPLPLRGTPSMS